MTKSRRKICFCILMFKNLTIHSKRLLNKTISIVFDPFIRIYVPIKMEGVILRVTNMIKGINESKARAKISHVDVDETKMEQ